MTQNQVESKIVKLESDLRRLRIALATLMTFCATFVLVGATCDGSSRVLNADDITVKRLFAEKVFVMDAPTDPSLRPTIGAVMTMAGKSANLVFFDEDGQAAVRIGYSPEAQGLSVLNPKQEAEIFIGRTEGEPAVILFGRNGGPLTRMRTTQDGGAIEVLDINGMTRVAMGVVDDDALIGVADADGNQIAGLPAMP